MKVCYFIQSHKNPEQILKLIAAIKKTSYQPYIIISHDFSSSFLDLKSFSHSEDIVLFKRDKPARRGNFSILDIFLETLEYLEQINLDFSWLVCLSGQDFPIQPISSFENFLAMTEYDGFLNYYDVFLSDTSTTKKKESEKCYFSQYINLPYWSKPFLKQLSKIESFLPFLKVQWYFAMLGVKSHSTPFTNNFRCYRGYYWNTLSKKCLVYLRSYLKDNPEVLKYYRRTLAPEESLIHTILINSKKFNLSQNSLQYAKYPPELRGFAETISVEDLPNLVAANYYFARKIDFQKDKKIFDFLENLYLSEVQKT
jgi:hypothetical protein